MNIKSCLFEMIYNGRIARSSPVQGLQIATETALSVWTEEGILKRAPGKNMEQF
jgi:hypothetical protein